MSTSRKVKNLRSETMAGVVNFRFVVVRKEKILQSLLFLNVLGFYIIFNLDEQWLLEYSLQY